MVLPTDTVASGVHTLTAKAYVADGAKIVTATNPELRIDHDLPTGSASAPGRYVARTVTVDGALADVHSGPRDWQPQLQGSDGVWRNLCDRAGPPALVCAWHTTDYSDGTYNLRAELRDSVAEANGGPNVAYSAAVPVDVDNTAPEIGLSGYLREAAEYWPLEWGQPAALHVDAHDPRSGVVGVEVAVDGVVRGDKQQDCGGSCSLVLDYELRPEEFGDGDHTITVRARDGVGNAAEQSWHVDVEAPPPPTPDDGESEPPAMDDTAASQLALSANDPRADLEQSLLSCTSFDEPANFDVFSLGPSFEGMDATAVLRRCDLPYATEAGRANFVSHIYGDCTVASDDDTGCAPPMEIQSWPACERSLADYVFSPDGEPVHEELLTLRGVPSAAFEDYLRLELYTGGTTVVVFGQDAAQVRRAVDVVQQEPDEVAPGLPASPAAGQIRASLPPPLDGATGGMLKCF